MDRLTTRPTGASSEGPPGRFQRFNLLENPFPAVPMVNRDSADKRINGRVYEVEIRKNEYDHIKANFLEAPQSSPNHLRLGYVIDTSYIGRGNGKSAFLVNLQQNINNEYCLDISGGINKCFAVYLAPEQGGRTKTFPALMDLLMSAILRMGIINSCLAIVRLEALRSVYPQHRIDPDIGEEELIANLNSEDWYKQAGLSYPDISRRVRENPMLQTLSPEFPLYSETNSFFAGPITQAAVEDYYNALRRPGDRLEFVFSDLVRFFQAAGFNGAYVLLDDFERVVSFQSAQQKTDFALELRSCLFDGLSTNARVGFYNVFLVLHAGVERLIADAWSVSGMSNRVPLEPAFAASHVIPFEKLSKHHAVLLIKKYLAEYRVRKSEQNDLLPFTEGAVEKMGELSELNAGRILKMGYELLEKAASTETVDVIDAAFVENAKDGISIDFDKGVPGIQEADSVDLIEKARKNE